MQKKILTLAVLAGLGVTSTYVLADDAAAPAAPAADAAAAPAAAPAAPPPVVLNGPGMNFPLTGAANPLNFDAGPIGKVYVSGAVSALAFTQNHATGVNQDFFHDSSTLDFSNAQIMLQKVDGLVQFFIQGGGYSIPVVGTAYLKASKATGDTYGVIPTAYIKIVPNDTISIQAGKLPTLFGAEYTYTFENTNIERGLLWNQENVFTRGVQANYAKGPLAVSVSVTDGFYSKDYTWGTALVSYTINDSNSITAVAGGNFNKSKTNELNIYTTPLAQNDGQIYNLIYKWTHGPLTLQPYLQLTHIPSESAASGLGWTKDTDTYGAALIANYAVNDTVNIGARAEWIGSSGNATDGSANLLGYGAGSDAWSLTITPTYQKGGFFARAEASYVKINSFAAGSGFNSTGTSDNQERLMLETGFLF
jgi:hypothetical protein